MSKLVQSNRNKKSSSALTRGPQIEPQQTFTLDKTPTNSTKDYRPQATSMKIDSTLRDKINALSLVGVADTQKEIVELALDALLEKMSDEVKEKYVQQYALLEQRSIEKWQRQQ